MTPNFRLNVEIVPTSSTEGTLYLKGFKFCMKFIPSVEDRRDFPFKDFFVGDLSFTHLVEKMMQDL